MACMMGFFGPKAARKKTDAPFEADGQWEDEEEVVEWSWTDTSAPLAAIPEGQAQGCRQRTVAPAAPEAVPPCSSVSSAGGAVGAIMTRLSNLFEGKKQ